MSPDMSDTNITILEPMTKKEAAEAVSKINDSALRAAVVLKEFYDRDGWKALGYDTWKACVEKEFEITRQRAHQLIDAANLQAQMSTVVDAPSLSERGLRELKGVPEAKMPGVIKAIKSIAAASGHQVPTARDVAEAAAPVKAAASKTDPEKKPAVKNLAPSKDDTALKTALKRIEDICGKQARVALETQAVNMKRADVLLFAKQRDDTMGAIQELVLTQRWKVQKAIKFVNKMVDQKTKIGDLMNLCIAEGGRWEGTVNSFDIVVTRRKK